MRGKFLFFLLAPFMTTALCQQPIQTTLGKMELLDSVAFSSSIDGRPANLYTLRNDNGMVVYLTNFGARLIGLVVPDKNGNAIDVVMGLPTVADYNTRLGMFFGPIVGPFANRIANGKFELGDKTYQLAANSGPNTLHGGYKGVHFASWEVERLTDTEVEFRYLLPDQHEGFPGNIAMKVIYALGKNNELTISYEATTDKETVINLSNHAYFNLNGEGSGSILNHELQLFAEAFTPVNRSLIPTGDIQAVKDNPPFDFTKLKPIGKGIDEDNVQLAYGKGYDHNFVLGREKFQYLNHAAKLIGDQSGIIMDLYTNEPGIQFYSGNFMSGKSMLKNGGKDEYRSGLCLEPQHFPDSPNQPSFPSTVLKPDEKYQTKSVYRFSTVQ